MSIAAGTQKALRSFRSLIVFDMSACFFIKDLKDLAVGPARFSIDIKVLKDLKRHLLTVDTARDRPSRYGSVAGYLGVAIGFWCVVALRGTGPRATVSWRVISQSRFRLTCYA